MSTKADLEKSLQNLRERREEKERSNTQFVKKCKEENTDFTQTVNRALINIAELKVNNVPKPFTVHGKVENFFGVEISVAGQKLLYSPHLTGDSFYFTVSLNGEEDQQVFIRKVDHQWLLLSRGENQSLNSFDENYIFGELIKIVDKC